MAEPFACCADCQFTETSVEAGKNNEYREPKACRLGPFRPRYAPSRTRTQGTFGHRDVRTCDSLGDAS